MLPTLSLGEQIFTKIRNKNQLYIDKTERIFELIHYSDYIFLSRPRRFGKSLLISTLEALFEGKKELFEDLWIADKWNWEEKYAVIRIDFGRITSKDSLDKLNKSLLRILKRYAKTHQVTIDATIEDAREYMDELMIELYDKTGKGVVILIDEYDKPITDNLIDADKAEEIRDWLREFYGKFKAQSEYLRFFFITGISKFAKMSVFSVLGNLKDVSLLPQFNDVVGFTLEEIIHNFPEHLQALAEKEGVTREKVLEALQYWYNGYSWRGKKGIYNPYGVLNVLRDLEFYPYWFETSTPYFLVELIRKKYPFPHEKPPVLKDFVNVQATPKMFDNADLRNIHLTAVLFQTGYLTILKTEKPELGQFNFTLGYPNHEVRWSFNSYLIELFTAKTISNNIEIKASALKTALRKADFETFFSILQSFFSSIPYPLLKQYTEHTYQSLFYMLLTMLGVEIDELDLEKPNYTGRADGILTLDNIVYVIEFKFARKGKLSTLVAKAMDQILERGYHLPYMSGQKSVYQLGVAFLSKTDTEGKTVLTMGYDKKQLK